MDIKVPSNLMTDIDEWYDFIKFSATNTFYVGEETSAFNSYAAFNCKPAETKQHSQTDRIGVSSIKFDALAKVSEFYQL